MDFSKMGAAKSQKNPTNPIKLFEALPSLQDTINDLWRGQASALEEWDRLRNKSDILLSLNTGAGKTVVGLLIAQSLVNEGVDNVIYVCSTNDLAKQTALEAERIGIPYTIREQAKFSNDLFESGKAFCITTYAALFNSYSSIRRKFFPGAILFDDAHVAEGILRNAFTLRVGSAEHPAMFNEIASLFTDHFDEMGISHRFKEALTTRDYSSVLAAPRGLQERAKRLADILERYDVSSKENLKYPYGHLKDHLEACAAVFTRGVFELAPPFLPTLAMDIFNRKVRRVYLSATLTTQTEFIRSFGRAPTDIIAPNNDAGNGERLVIFGSNIQDGFKKDFVEVLSRQKKVLIAVPSYFHAQTWQSLAVPPDSANFSSELTKFRKAPSGNFLLVSRVDGIDLPHDTCRIMLMDGLPGGTSLLERFQWEFLRMTNVHSYKVATRIAQLFGRINRGRNDYGVFLVEGRDLNVWLNKDRNLYLLPALLQKQILLGREAQEGMGINNLPSVVDAINAVLSRNQSWIDYYTREVKLGELDKEQIERASEAEPEMIKAAFSEGIYAEAIWNKDYSRAWRELEKTLDETAKIDTPLAGWHSIWLGAAYDLDGDRESAETAYALARSRLGSAVALPLKKRLKDHANEAENINSFGSSLTSCLSFTHGGKFENELSKYRMELDKISSGTPRQAEAAVRLLGEILGFSSIRPDNDQGTGPDNVWINENARAILGFELKTDKAEQAVYFKKEIAQGHDHISWMEANYPGYKIEGLVYIGSDGIAEERANPSPLMVLCETETICHLRDELMALISDLRGLTPLERLGSILKESQKEKWTLENLKRRFTTKTFI